MPGKIGRPGREPRDEVGPHLLLDRARAPAGVSQLAEGGGAGSDGEADRWSSGPRQGLRGCVLRLGRPAWHAGPRGVKRRPGGGRGAQRRRPGPRGWRRACSRSSSTGRGRRGSRELGEDAPREVVEAAARHVPRREDGGRQPLDVPVRVARDRADVVGGEDPRSVASPTASTTPSRDRSSSSRADGAAGQPLEHALEVRRRRCRRDQPVADDERPDGEAGSLARPCARTGPARSRATITVGRRSPRAPRRGRSPGPRGALVASRARPPPAATRTPRPRRRAATIVRPAAGSARAHGVPQSPSIGLRRPGDDDRHPRLDEQPQEAAQLRVERPDATTRAIWLGAPDAGLMRPRYVTLRSRHQPQSAT